MCARASLGPLEGPTQHHFSSAAGASAFLARRPPRGDASTRRAVRLTVWTLTRHRPDRRMARDARGAIPCVSAASGARQTSAKVVPSTVAIGGLSSGGGLAAALAFLARDRGEIQLAFQLLSPNLDDRTGSQATGRRRLVWSEGDNRQAWRWYLGDADPAVAAPARRTDLAGLAPAWIGTGSLDLLHDEAVEYGRRLHEAGTPCHVEIAAGAFHAFDFIVPDAPVSLTFFASQCDHLRAALARATT